MPIMLTRRAVTGALVAAPLTGFARSADADSSVDGLLGAWENACAATEAAWGRETAVIDWVMARPPDPKPEFDASRAVAHWRGIERRARDDNDYDRTLAILERAMTEPAGPDCADGYRDFQGLVQAVGRPHVGHVRGAVEEGLPDAVASILKAESDEDALAARILAETARSQAARALQELVRRRVATVEPVGPVVADGRRDGLVPDVAYDPGSGALAGGAFTPAEFVRRLERAGYVVIETGELFPVNAVETPEQLRCRGRLAACARSVPDFARGVAEFISNRADRPHMTAAWTAALDYDGWLRRRAVRLRHGLSELYVDRLLRRIA